MLRIVTILLVSQVLFQSCDESPKWQRDGKKIDLIENDIITLNPFQISPLTAMLKLELTEEASIVLNIKSKVESDADFTHRPAGLKLNHTIPILGLYPDHINKVELSFFNRSGEKIGSQTYNIQTQALPTAMPEVVVNMIDSSKGDQTFTLVSQLRLTSDIKRFVHDVAQFVGVKMQDPPYPFIFDNKGAIRWYFDFEKSDEMDLLKYYNGIERLQNGNWYFGDNTTNQIYEMDMLGQIINRWEMPGWEFHHHVLEKPNGNFLASVNKTGVNTIMDYVIEIDRTSGEVNNVWDLNISLDNTRDIFKKDSVDWIHVNGLAYDQLDSTIVVSGRTQGIIKLTKHNEVVWIMSPHLGWGKSGRGEDLSKFLLYPVNSLGDIIDRSEVWDGIENHAQFEWPWGPHAPFYKPNGNLMLFDNGDTRNYSKDTLYSRAVEYQINDSTMTIKQIWSYGKSRGSETYSRIVSDVDFLPENNSVLFSPGAITGDTNNGKIIEINYTTGEVISEASVITEMVEYRPTFHRVERLDLYPY